MFFYFLKSTVGKRVSKLVTRAVLSFACFLITVLVSLLLTSESRALTCPTLSKGDEVVMQNVGKQHEDRSGLNVREYPNTNRDNNPKAKVYDGTDGVILSDKPVYGSGYIWYKVRWYTPSVIEGWSVGIYDGTKVIATISEARQKDELVEALFNLNPGSADAQTRHDYNDYGCTWPDHPYIGGHAGWDVVIDSDDPVFHALIGGVLIEDGEDKNNTIAVYNQDHEITVLYLHADEVKVSMEGSTEDRIIQKDQPLGIQGSTGPNVTGAHVHIEVIEGEWGSPSAGTDAQQEQLSPSTDPIPTLYELRQLYEDEQPSEPGLGGGTEFLRSDVNKDNRVDILDLLLVWTHINSDPNDFQQFDVNGDGFINREDIIEVAENMELPGDRAAPIAFSHNQIEGITIRAGQVYIGSTSVSREAVQQLLHITREVDDGSLVFKQSIAMLENILSRITPNKTLLFSNYPNPFNPETWIPYQLARESKVSVIIYDVKGIVVRTLDLGHQAIGNYISRSRAAYWDGCNEFGERVASGIYFYTLTVGEFTATRKMLIRK